MPPVGIWGTFSYILGFHMCGMIRNHLLLAHHIPLPPPRYPVTPEKRLMLAILQDAVACLKKGFFRPSQRCSRPASEVVQWMTQRDRTWLFSFENICDNLNLDAEALRQQLLGKERDRHMAGRRPA